MDDALPQGTLRIDELPVLGGGVIGMCHFPGRQGVDGRGRRWARDPSEDLSSIQRWGASAVLSLVESHEFAHYGVPDLGARVRSLGLDWLHLPIPDMGVPNSFEPVASQVLQRLRLGDKVLVHCAAGLGRTGTLAAALLVDLGAEPQAAIARVRQARPGTLETAAQEDLVHQRARGPAAGQT